MQTADSKYFNQLISKLAVYVGRNLRIDDVVAALTQVCSMHGRYTAQKSKTPIPKDWRFA